MIDGGVLLITGVAVSPLSLLKNPMILITVVGLAFVFGMPYMMDSSKSYMPLGPCICTDIPSLKVDPEMKKEFEEQQKKSILSGGASTPNPLQNFDMAAWMAGKTAGSSEPERDEGNASGSGSGGVSKARRRG